MKGIYCYIDKKDNNIVYVGKDSYIYKDKRHGDHITPSKYNQQPINKVLQNNPDRYEYHKLVELSDDFTDNDLNDLEEYFIKEFNTYHYVNRCGFNFTLGGDGATGFKVTEETKRKISESLKGEKSPKWKDYARVIKGGKKNGKLNYILRYNGKRIVRSIHYKKLEKIANIINRYTENNKKLSEEDIKKIIEIQSKYYATVVKNGKTNSKQTYLLKYNGKHIKCSTNKEMLKMMADDINQGD